MDDGHFDNLPPPPRRHDQPAFSRSLGGIFGQFVWIAAFFAIAALILYVVTRWL